MQYKQHNYSDIKVTQDLIDFAIEHLPCECKRGDWYLPFIRDGEGNIEAGDIVWVESDGYAGWEDVTEDIGTPMKEFFIVAREKTPVLLIKENPMLPNL